MHAGNLARLESTRPMRFFEPPAKTRLLGRDAAHRVEAVLEEASEKLTVPQVLGRLSLRVQQRLDSLDDLVASR